MDKSTKKRATITQVAKTCRCICWDGFELFKRYGRCVARQGSADTGMAIDCCWITDPGYSGVAFPSERKDSTAI